MASSVVSQPQQLPQSSPAPQQQQQQATSAPAPQQQPSSTSYTSISELTRNLLNKINKLSSFKSDNDNANNIKKFFDAHSTYSKSNDIDDKLNNIETQLNEYATYQSNVTDYIDKCYTYVDSSKEILNSIDSAIDQIISNLKSNELPKIKSKLELENVESAINTVKSQQQQQSQQQLLAELQQNLTEYNAEIMKKINEELSVTDFQEKFNSNMDDFISTKISEKVNKIIESINNTIKKLLTEFTKKMKEIDQSSQAQILDDNDIESIKKAINEFNDNLNKYLKESGGDDTLFKLLSDYLTEKFKELQQKTIDELDKLGKFPEEKNSGIQETAGGGNGTGDGNASTFAAYPVSNKSQKNRNNGNGNSRGKGKGKGKSKNRKPNATKKNNRH